MPLVIMSNPNFVALLVAIGRAIHGLALNKKLINCRLTFLTHNQLFFFFLMRILELFIKDQISWLHHG